MSSRCPGARSSTSSTPSAVADAVRDVDGVLHLATRIRPLEQLSDPDAWRENDRLRADASRILVDAAIAAGAAVYVQPTVTFVYPPDGPVSEDTPVGEVSPILRSALAAEQQTERFARAGGRGVVLRLGLLDGPGTWRRTRRWPTSAPRCTSPMPGARSSRRCRCPAASTTSAVTGSVSRASASPGPPDGIRQRESSRDEHDHLSDNRPPEPLRPAAVAAPPRRPAPASERLGRGHGESRGRGWISRGRDHQRRRGRHARLSRTTRVRRPTRCSPRPRGSPGASRCP